MTGERTCCRARRRILGDSGVGREHSGLPARAGAGRAARHHLERRERRDVRPQIGNLLLRAEEDERGLRAVVVALDR